MCTYVIFCPLEKVILANIKPHCAYNAVLYFAWRHLSMNMHLFLKGNYILPISKAAIRQGMKIVRSCPSLLMFSSIFPTSSKENSSSVSLHSPFSLFVVAKRMVRSVSIRKMIDPKLCSCRFFRHVLISAHKSCSAGETIFWDGFHTLRTICLLFEISTQYA